MNNYQIVAARTQTMNPIPNTPRQATTKIPTFNNPSTPATASETASATTNTTKTGIYLQPLQRQQLY